MFNLFNLFYGQIETRYSVIRPLGDGSYAFADLCRRKADGLLVTIKKSKNATSADKTLENEKEILLLLDHPRIPHYLDSYTKNNAYTIVITYCPGVDFFEFLNHHTRDPSVRDYLEDSSIVQIFKKLCRILKYAHSCGVIHRDIKLENIIINYELEPYIIDWGLSSRMTDLHYRRPGSLEYVSPEVIQEGTPYFGPENDVWALGVCLFSACTMLSPYATCSSIYEQVLGYKINLSNPLIPDTIRTILSRTFVPYSTRISLDEFETLLGE